jgi:hypothetical protein
LEAVDENTKHATAVFPLVAKVAIGDLFCAVFAGLFVVRIH